MPTLLADHAPTVATLERLPVPQGPHLRPHAAADNRGLRLGPWVAGSVVTLGVLIAALVVLAPRRALDTTKTPVPPAPATPAPPLESPATPSQAPSSRSAPAPSKAARATLPARPSAVNAAVAAARASPEPATPELTSQVEPTAQVQAPATPTAAARLAAAPSGPIALAPDAPRPVPDPRNRRPLYPRAQFDAGIEGTVLVKLLVSETGEVLSAEALSGEEPFVQAALDAARGWRYQPLLIEGTPRPVYFVVPVPFRRPRAAAPTVPR
jgi:protein TonB